MAENALIKREEINVVEIFTEGKFLPILEKIKEKATIENPDITTAKGRALIKSNAAKVASSKVLLDNLGKDTLEEWKKQVKAGDSSRKTIRDSLDYLKAEVRLPLTTWENEKKEAERIEQEQKQKAEDWISAIEEDFIFDEKRKLDREKERLKKEEEKRIQKEKIKAELEEKQQKEKTELMQREAKAKADAERAKQEKEKAIEQAKIDKENARIQAEKEKQDAVEAEKKRQEDARIKKEAEDKKRSEDLEHRKAINNKILNAFVEKGFDRGMAKKFIIATIEMNHENIKVIY
jgi:hypothetical protein